MLRGYIFLLLTVGANAYLTGISPNLITSPVASLRLGRYAPHTTSQVRHTRLTEYYALIKTPRKDSERIAGDYHLCAKRLSDDGSSGSVSKHPPLHRLFQLLRGGSRRPKSSSSSSRLSVFVLAASKFKSFEEMLNIYHDVPVLVTFSSRMCGPCRTLGQEMDHVRDAMKDSIKTFNVDTDRFPDLSSRYNVKELPCTLLFKNGDPVGRIQGVKTAQDLIQQIKKITE